MWEGKTENEKKNERKRQYRWRWKRNSLIKISHVKNYIYTEE
jgi:hypothetical protein